MVILLNSVYKFSTVILSVCLVCCFVVGCGGKTDSSEKQKQTQEIVRKIPAAETQPQAAPGKKQKAQPRSDKSIKVAAPEQKTAAPRPKTAKQQAPAASKQVPAPMTEKTVAPAGQPQAAPEVTAGLRTPEKQAEIDAITREAAKTDIKTETGQQVIGAEAAGGLLEEGQETAMLTSDESAATQGASPVIDLGLKGASESGSDGLDFDEEGPSDELYNPFAPLFQKKDTGVVSDIPSIRTEREKFLTELEKIDVGQLTLKGVIQAQSGNRAVLVDARGKGYVVKEGTYVGLNSGTVENIESDRIAIVETIGMRQSKTVLKLQKPAGE